MTLDFFAQQFFSAVPTERPELLKRAQAYIGTLGSQEAKVNASAEYYIKAMERMLSKGETWLVKEQAR